MLKRVAIKTNNDVQIVFVSVKDREGFWGGQIDGQRLEGQSSFDIDRICIASHFTS